MHWRWNMFLDSALSGNTTGQSSRNFWGDVTEYKAGNGNLNTPFWRKMWKFQWVALNLGDVAFLYSNISTTLDMKGKLLQPLKDLSYIFKVSAQSSFYALKQIDMKRKICSCCPTSNIFFLFKHSQTLLSKVRKEIYFWTVNIKQRKEFPPNTHNNVLQLFESPLCRTSYWQASLKQASELLAANTNSFPSNVSSIFPLNWCSTWICLWLASEEVGEDEDFH